MMLCSCCSRPNGKQLLLAMLAVAVFVFVYEMIFHGMMLKATYQATAELWRPEADMQAKMIWLMLAQALMAIMFCLIFSFTRMCNGIQGGVCFGLLVGLLMSAPQIITYVVQPIPADLLLKWLVGGMLEAVLMGVIVALIYKPQIHDKQVTR